ncbi:MAG TPA: L-aspartate oxidase [Chitinophagaceae bacterium]|nr:MAG: L-aspartate oxidase [Bacteroidetes bacterium OLB11]HMN32256.1 L-aspartate oxidase [Chitinophagaceae bacterium]
METDVLVIGSGIAGLTYAVNLAINNQDLQITILTKTNEEETNTKYAQGGVAAVFDLNNDSYEKHIEDTLIAGDGLCNRAIVDIVVHEGPERMNEMISWGADFDKEENGVYKLGKEGGHSQNRILHYKDITGFEIERALLAKAHQFPNIQFVDYCFVLDLITQHHLGELVTKSSTNIHCFGVYVLNIKTQQIEKIISKVTMLATGGCGQVYRTTTNPKIATGDGVAMVYRAKGRIENMEFIQFHPTALFEAGKRFGQSFLITEAVRGDGGILRNSKGEDFMKKYDSRLSLAPRDIVARAIDNEMKILGDEHVYLDCRHMNIEKFKEHFPNIYDKCLSIGVDVSKDMIPVAPAAHYSCGGVKTDEYARTSIKNLYCCGESASTGLHGANRLASNSLLEALVFGKRAFEDTMKTIANISFQGGIPDWNASGTMVPKEMILITQSLKEVQLAMTDYVGIVRSNVRLSRAMRRIDLLHEETEQLYKTTTLSPQLCELRNLITASYLIIKSAQFRKESRGLHYTIDYSEKSAIVQNITL